MQTLLQENRIVELLSTIPFWSREGGSLTATFKLPGFPEAIEFVGKVARLAEDANHHPDIDIRWNKVTLRLSTHSAGGLTELDFKLASKISAI